MTKHLITAAAALLVTFGGAACLPTPEPTLPQHPAIEANDLGRYFDADAEPPAVVVWPNDGQPHGNIEPPTRLDIADTTSDECDDMGGTWVQTPGNGYGTCQGVDY